MGKGGDPAPGPRPFFIERELPRMWFRRPGGRSVMPFVWGVVPGYPMPHPSQNRSTPLLRGMRHVGLRGMPPRKPVCGALRGAP
jgi:hypothetical protein